MAGGPPFSHRIIVGSLATFLGIYACWDAARDFELIKFTPHPSDEVARRKAENNTGIKIHHQDVLSLQYTPEAKEKIRRLEEQRKAQEAAASSSSSS